MSDRTVSWKAMADFSKARKEADRTAESFRKLQRAEDDANANSIKTSDKADDAGAKRDKGLKGLIGRLGEYSKETTKAETGDKKATATTLTLTEAERKRLFGLKALAASIQQRGRATKDAEAADKSAISTEESHTSALQKLERAVKAATAANEGNAKQSKSSTAALKQGVSALQSMESATQRVTEAQNAQAKAQNNVERTTLSLKQAEEKLATTKASSATDSDKVRRAEIDLERARINSSKATNDLQVANTRLSDSHSRIERSTRQVTEANKDMDRSFTSSGKSMRQASDSGDGLGGTLRKLGRDSGGAASGMLLLSRIFGLMKIPLVIGGIIQLVSALAALGAGAFAVVGALGPVVGILATIPTLGFAAAGALGTVLSAFSGVGDALKAQSAAQKSAATDAIASAKAQQQAARKVADSIRAVKDAQQAQRDAAVQGAQSIAAANRSLQDAQRAQTDTAVQGAQSIRRAELDLQGAQKSAVQAQLQLTQARQDAIRTLKELKQTVKDEALSEERASLTVDQAKERLAQTLRDPGASDLERRDAQLSVREAQAALERTKQQAKESAAELAKAQKLGVEKSGGVVSAKEAERQAILGVGDAQKNLADTIKQTTRNNADAARTTADAQKAVGQAVKQAAKSQEQAARNVADAQRNLTDAYASQAEAANSSSAAATKAKEAMLALSPAGRKFVQLLLDLKGNLKTIRDSAQAGLFPGLGSALQRLATLTPLVAGAFGAFGKALGRAAGEIANVMTTPLFKAQFKELVGTTVKVLDLMGKSFANIIGTLANIAVAAQPLTLWLVRMTKGWTDTWLAMTSGEDARTKMETFFEKTRDILKIVGSILGGLAKGFIGVGKAGESMGLELLTMLDGTINKWAEWTNSVEGQNELKQYFDDAKPVIVEIARLFRDVAKALLGLGNDKGTADLIHQLRTELLPALVELQTAVTNGLLPSFVHLVTEAVKLFTKLSNNSAIKNVVDALGGMLDAVNALIDAFPFLGDALGYILTAMAGLAIIGSVVSIFAGFVTTIELIAAALGFVAVALGISVAALIGWILVIAAVVAAVAIAAFFIHKYWDQIMSFFKKIGTAILNFLKDTWAKIKDAIVDPIVSAAKATWEWLGKVWSGFVNILKKVLSFLVWWGTNLYNYWIAPIVHAIAVIGGLLGRLQDLIWAALLWVVKQLAKAGVWIYNNAIKPFVDFLKKANELWDQINDAIAAGVNKVLAWLGTNIPKAYGVITKPFQDAWNWVVAKFGPGISKAFSNIWDGIQKTAEGFKKILGKVWDGLKKVFRDPIEWVVNKALGALVGAYNQLVQMLGLGNANDPKNRGISIQAPKVNFARGGVYPGYTPGKDIGVVGVSGGEAIMRPEWTRAMGKKHVDEMNAAARRGGVSGVRRKMDKKKRGYASGGVVPDSLGDYASGGAIRSFRGKKLNTRTIAMLLAAESLPQMRKNIFTITQGSYHPGLAASGGTHDGGGVMDTNGPAGWGNSVWSLRRTGFAAWHRTPQQGFPHHIHSVALGDESASPAAKQQMADFRQGRNGLAGGGKDDGPKVTIDPNLAKKFQIAALTTGGAGPPGSGGSWLDSLVGWVRDAVSNPIAYFKNKVAGPIKDMAEKFGNTKIVQTMAAVPGKIISGMAGKISAAVGGLVSRFLGPSESFAPTNITSNPVTRAKVLREASAYGWGSGNEWNALDRLIQKESGWNPAAQNPKSTAYGLFQFLNGTWASTGYSKSADPTIQAKAGLKYIKTKYGSPSAALTFHNSHNWYEEGGLVPKMLFNSNGPGDEGVQALRRGGTVLGSGSGDKVPALLEPGEFVVRKQVAQRFKSQLEELNSKKITGKTKRPRKQYAKEGVGPVQAFHAGGPVLGMRPGTKGTSIRAIRYLLALPTGAAAQYGVWDGGLDRILRQSGAYNKLVGPQVPSRTDPKRLSLVNYIKNAPANNPRSYAQARDALKLNDASMLKMWEAVSGTVKKTPAAKWRKLEQGYIAKRQEMYGYVGYLNKSIGLSTDGSVWTSHGRSAMKHILEHAYGQTHDPLEYRPWSPLTVVEAAASAQKAANDQQKIFNTALETLSGWGLTDLVTDLLEKGVGEGLNIAFDAAKNRPAAQILNDQIALSKLLNSDDQGNILKLISLFSGASGQIGLRDAARAVGLSDLDTVLLIEKGLKASRFNSISSKMTQVRADIASYRAGTFYGNRGGQVPGSGRGDKVPAMLEPGEFVIRRKAAEYLGLRRLEDLNNPEIQKMREGGLVQQFQLMSSPVPKIPSVSTHVANAGAGAGGGNTYNYNYDVDINNPVAEKSTVSLTKALQKQAAMTTSTASKET